ncbi:MAG: ferredoxin-NAD reductase [Betaproteobacteria bacterium RIFCSPLOWO2_02_FULL_62_17]|nr:MAG: ferredoxin-NAD reductase [Betaproteobacteria bacterium RIFCSPLOWO2_02_FULL_62_17]
MLNRIQSAGQAVFLGAERVFNRVFGDRLNPLYHLGSISYWMFWVVIASGFYVYAFYETSAEETFASVEAITHRQPWAGGIMRSLHRYASDAMTLTMLLHLLRHFLFGRYRGFRAFSWITGVTVLWLVYASGINGYMLPWDRLAQFVVVATAELFDALPVFNGALIRNFITPEGITDRFFSLLSFMHIGIPLGVLLLLTVHTQRVPKARVMPPRPVAWATLAMLAVIAVAKPALSQGAADFSNFPQVLGFDWFVLPVYPLIYLWPPLAVWALLSGATLFLLFLPWISPGGKALGSAQITAHPGNRCVAAHPGETVLDACLRAGVPLPHECRNGGCAVCKTALLAGAIDFGHYQGNALSAEERSRGFFLSCCATAQGDIEIEYEPGARDREHARLYTARVEALQPLAPDVMLVRLRLPEGERIAFEAGQFINIILEDGERRAYSFSSAPDAAASIDLHVRLLPGGRFSTHVFNVMRPGDEIHFEGPLGYSSVEDKDKPLILVAGSTGFAPVKSVLEHAFESGFRRPLIFYWGVRRRRDLYLAALPEQWQREHDNFRFVPVLSDPQPEDEWKGRTGLVHEAILADYPDLSGYEIYACGSVQMVDAARPAFLAQGLTEDACISDAFLPAVRKGA